MGWEFMFPSEPIGVKLLTTLFLEGLPKIVCKKGWIYSKLAILAICTNIVSITEYQAQAITMKRNL
jgi:hypothetical protein